MVPVRYYWNSLTYTGGRWYQQYTGMAGVGAGAGAETRDKCVAGARVENK